MNVPFGNNGTIAGSQGDKAAKSRRFPTKTLGLLFVLGSLAVLNTDILQSNHVRMLCKTIFDYPDWDQYWEDLFAPKIVYAGAGKRSLLPMQHNNVGYFLTLMNCPEDNYPAADPNDPGHAFYDAAALLKYSIVRNTYPAASKYNATMYAIIHPEAITCKGPNFEMYDRAKILQDLGYKVTVLGSPIYKGLMKGYVKDNIDMDAGERDFMRLHALTYDHHPAIVLVDFTTLMMKPMDSIFDEFINNPTHKFRVAYDYPDQLPNTGKNIGIDTHWIMMKPSQTLFSTLAEAYKKSYYSPSMGWDGQGIKGFKGVLGLKGFLIHYFTTVEKNTHGVLPRCRFGNDGSSPHGIDQNGQPTCRDPLDCQDCRAFDFDQINVIKMIHKCGKPWACSYDDNWDASTKKTCEGFHRAWFSARIDFEQSCLINGPPSFRNGAFKPDVFMGFCACSGISCYDRILDDKAAAKTCDKDTKTTTASGRITFPNGGFQDQTLSLTTGQVTGTTTACVTGQITLSGFEPPFNLGIVIDVSGSTYWAFGGSEVGDVNKDGRANSIIDAEIAAVIAVLENIASSPGLGNHNVNVGLTKFDTDADYLGMFMPCEPNDPSKVNKVLLDTLLGLRTGGRTHFDDALDKTILYFQEAPKDRSNILLFLSDGIPNVVGDGDKEEPSSKYVNNGKGTLDYASEIAVLDTLKVKRIAVGVGTLSDVRPGFGLDMIDNTPDPYTGKGPVLALTTDELKNALLNNPIAGGIVDFTVSVNGAVQTNIDKAHVKAGPTGFMFGRFIVSGLDPRHGVVNEIAVTAIIDYDGMEVSTDDQVVLTTTTLISGSLF